MSPSDVASPKMKVALNTATTSLRKIEEKSIEGSMLDNAGYIYNLSSSILSSSIELELGNPKLKNQPNPNNSQQTHPYPTQNLGPENSVTQAYPDNPLAQVNLENIPHHPSDTLQSTYLKTEFQQSKNLQFVIGLHRGIRKKSTKQRQRKKNWAAPSKSSFLDSLMEKRNKTTTKEAEEMDIIRFIEFSKKLEICFVGKEEAFASKFCEMEERDLGHHLP
ncbi:hypothetical protein SLE2022_397800 [Rubroshorea leprosula]